MKLEPLIAKKAKEKQAEGGRDKVVQISAQASDERKTREQVAKIAGVSHDTIAKAKMIEEKAAETVKAALRQGETTINKEYQKIKEDERGEDPVPSKGKRKPGGHHGSWDNVRTVLQALENAEEIISGIETLRPEKNNRVRVADAARVLVRKINRFIEFVERG